MVAHGRGSAARRAPRQRTGPSCVEAPHAAVTSGEVSQLDECQSGPLWQDLDAWGRIRRVGRLLAAAVAIALAIGAWSLMSARAGLPGHTPGATTVQQLDEAPGELRATALLSTPSGHASAAPSARRRPVMPLQTFPSHFGAPVVTRAVSS